MDKETSINFKEIWELFKETDTKFKETDSKFKETDSKFKETDSKFQETATRINELTKQIKELNTLFTGQWGKLIESLAESGIVKLLQSRGIDITGLTTRAKRAKGGRQIEIDFLLLNSNELVLGEVKTTLKIQDVRDFLDILPEFLYFFPEYKDYKIYGAMIGVRIEEYADKYAYRQGLFVFKVGGDDSLTLLNDNTFKPKDFSL